MLSQNNVFSVKHLKEFGHLVWSVIAGSETCIKWPLNFLVSHDRWTLMTGRINMIFSSTLPGKLWNLCLYTCSKTSMVSLYRFYYCNFIITIYMPLMLHEEIDMKEQTKGLLELLHRLAIGSAATLLACYSTLDLRSTPLLNSGSGNGVDGAKSHHAWCSHTIVIACGTSTEEFWQLNCY